MKRRRFCKGHKHIFLGMAGDICKNCDYTGRAWKIKERYLKRYARKNPGTTKLA